MNFSGDDIKKGWMVCRTCNNRVFQLCAGFAEKESVCDKCDCHTVPIMEFFKDENKDN